MGSFNLIQLIKDTHPDLKRKYESEQYKYSGELVRFRMENSLAQEDMADFLGMDIITYLKLEDGSPEIPISKYKEALKKLELGVNKKSESFRETIAKDLPNFKVKYNSQQHRLSKEIIKFKLVNRLSQDKMADILKVDYDTYLGLESGSPEIPVSLYISCLEKLHKA